MAHPFPSSLFHSGSHVSWLIETSVWKTSWEGRLFVLYITSYNVAPQSHKVFPSEKPNWTFNRPFHHFIKPSTSQKWNMFWDLGCVSMFLHLLCCKYVSCPEVISYGMVSWQWRKHSSDTWTEGWAFLKYKSTPVRTKLCPPYLESGQIWLVCHQLADSSSLAIDALSGVQRWSLLLVVWAVSHWEKNHKSELIHSFHPCHPRYFVVGLIGTKVGGWGKRTGIQEKEHLVHLCSGSSLMGIM